VRAVAATAVFALVPALAPSAAASPRFPTRQALVGLLNTHIVRAAPQVNAKRIGFVRPTRPITGARTVLPVIAHRRDAARRDWVRVRLPGRALDGAAPPSAGWIRTSDTRSASTGWHLAVDVGARRVRVYYRGHPVRTFAAIVGKRSTPTPAGEYFVEENVRLSRGEVGAPYALATSGRSHVLRQFDGGPGQIALHGLGGVGGHLGTAVSHGCVRLADRAITWLAARIGAGVPVSIS
jgi:lipoprotein-anchoring transpeptidase ErfK/SrfK